MSIGTCIILLVTGWLIGVGSTVVAAIISWHGGGRWDVD